MGPRLASVHGDLEFVVAQRGLCVTSIDYHAAPVHLTEANLLSLGLVLAGGHEGDRPPSVAKPWALSLQGHADRAGRGPALAKPDWSLPPGHRSGGLLFARVRDGLDVFVVDYHAGRACLSIDDIARLQLTWRGVLGQPVGEHA